MIAFCKMFSAKRPIFAILTAATLAACAPVPQGVSDDGIRDPYEADNRKVHAFNKRLFGKSNGTYARVVPDEFQTLLHNVADNLSMPQVAVNSLLQGNLRGAGVATYRFAVNSTIGLAGLIDATGEFNGPEHDTDFGETLHVWGVDEGAYLELPLFGPSTQRDTAGRVVDLFTDPLGYAIESPDKYARTGFKVLDKLGKGSRRSDVIGDLLNDSADSYAQARLIYLQKRRYELKGKASALPVYEDPYAQ